ncbi:MAG: hypothetical protein O6761_06850 [Thaumarchaeota archaeon]|nr:hypothetical protein [Nitrososphaerota archaeon]
MSNVIVDFDFGDNEEWAIPQQEFSFVPSVGETINLFTTESTKEKIFKVKEIAWSYDVGRKILFATVICKRLKK